MRQGFTLIEVITVLVIIAILSALALPQYGRTAERSRQAEAVTVLSAMRGAQIRYNIENDGVYAGLLSELDIDLPNYNGDGTSGDGKFFTYSLPGTVSDTNLAEATRNSLAQTGGIAGYVLKVNKEGQINCTTTGSGDCVTVLP